MTRQPNIMRNITEGLGYKLYNACRLNNVAQVAVLTSVNMDVIKWAYATLAAASERALDVATYCLRQEAWRSTTDRVFLLVFYYESLEPAYRFLVESGLMNPKHYIDWYGSMLGLVAGQHDERRYSLVEYLLEKGVNPDQRVDMYGRIFALAAAAESSDQKMLGILLDNGATLSGSRALLKAAERGNEDNVRYLLSRGADVNEMVPNYHPENTSSALHRAVGYGHVSVVDMLLEAGADVTLKDGKGRTAGEIAATKGMDGTILAKLDSSAKLRR